jgi:hypothetical protein
MVHNEVVAGLADLTGMNEMHASGHRIAALDRLAEHYGY